MRGVPALARAWTPQGGGEAAVVSSRSTLDHSTATPTPPPSRRSRALPPTNALDQHADHTNDMALDTGGHAS